ncbi:hypothetical protein Goarm_007506, partial [Gossypium armourianum]|nr:hypothetical protein [Gossypium armourianum]
FIKYPYKLTAASSTTPTAEDKPTASPDGVAVESESATMVAVEDPPFRGCKACGKEELERGCNGEGRIQGGIATVPGFGWWPIKAYRPCPAFVASGGRYTRRGQSMDEVASGGGGRVSPIGISDEAESSIPSLKSVYLNRELASSSNRIRLYEHLYACIVQPITITKPEESSVDLSVFKILVSDEQFTC